MLQRHNHMGTEEVAAAAAAHIPRIEVAAHIRELPHIAHILLEQTDMLVLLEVVVVVLLLAGTPWLQQP